MENNLVRIVKLLSQASIASRRMSAELIKSGRVKLNGEVITDAGRSADITKDVIEFDGKIVEFSEKKYYIMLNKPKGYICTHNDKFAEKKAVDLINIENISLYSAGRLDKDSEGLLIFSNDGDYINKLSHPRNQILKHYHVTVKKEFTNEELEKIRSGIIDDGETLRVHEVKHLSNKSYLFILNEGKKREIRRITSSVGSPTIKLKRFQVGKLQLGNLPIGKFRELTKEEIELSLI